MISVDSYLTDLAAVLRGSRREKRELLTEVRDHLTDAAQVRIDCGVTPRQAEVEAVREFGTVDEIAPSYQAVLSAGQCRRLSIWLLGLVIAQPLVWEIWDVLPATASGGAPSTAFTLADTYAETVGMTALGLALLVLVGGRLAFRHLGIREWMLRLVLTGALASSGLIVVISVAMAMTSPGGGSTSVVYAAVVTWLPMGLMMRACVGAIRGVDLAAPATRSHA